MHPPVFSFFLLLLLAGNAFALYKMITGREELITKYPRLTNNGFNAFRILPVINIIALIGIWYLEPWGAYLAIACGVITIACDLYFGIYYHLYVAIPFTLILLFFVLKYWNEFK